MLRRISVAFLLVFATICCYATDISTTVVSGVWTKAASPYIVKTNIEVPDGSSLTIEPGVNVVFDGHFKMQINGVLLANGNATDSIYFFPSDTLMGWRGIQIDNSSFVANGAMNDNDSTLLSYCILSYARNTGDNFYRGAAFYLRDFSKLRISNCVFRNNYSMFNTHADGSGKGAGLFLRDTKALVERSLFTQNHVGDDGGALYIDNAGYIVNCTFIYNTAYEDGGAIAAFNGVHFHNCIIDSNISITQEGGGIYSEGGIEIKECTITNNKTGIGGSGGGIYAVGNCSIDNCNVSGNSCGKLGGGIYATDKGVINNSIIRSNHANEGGGITFNVSAIAASGYKLISNCQVQNNTAAIAGGIKMYEASLVNCLVTNNEATTIGGGIRGERSAIVNCTIANNKGPGGGAISSKAKNSVYNTVVWNNAAPQMASDFSADDVQYSIVDRDPYGAGNNNIVLSSAPGFITPVSFTGSTSVSAMEIETANWQLKNGSALINQGSNNLYSSTFPAQDLELGARIKRLVIDIGAYESDNYGLSVADAVTSPCSASISYDPPARTISVNGSFSKALLTITSADGRVHDVYNVAAGSVISLSDTVPAIYIVRLQSENEIVTKKIVLH